LCQHDLLGWIIYTQIIGLIQRSELVRFGWNYILIVGIAVLLVILFVRDICSMLKISRAKRFDESIYRTEGELPAKWGEDGKDNHTNWVAISYLQDQQVKAKLSASDYRSFRAGEAIILDDHSEMPSIASINMEDLRAKPEIPVHVDPPTPLDPADKVDESG
jgi:hypothetical protein